MVGYQQIIASLKSSPNANEAIALTIQRSESNAHSFCKYVRRKFLRDESNRDPQYLQRLRHFQQVHFGPQDPEWAQLEDLMERPLHHQHRVETSRRPFLKRHDAALKEIRCVCANFYDYKMPDEIVEEAVEREQERREARHMKPQNIGNIQLILSKALAWRQHNHPWELVACASILCGRRTQEILWAMEWERESDRILQVRGLLKQAVGAGPIPILTDYEDFAALMAKIREHAYPHESTTHRLKPAFVRVFGEWLNHSERRNLYCEAAYRMRMESGFFPGLPQIMWFDKALCHDKNVIHQAPNLTYQTLTFDERDRE